MKVPIPMLHGDFINLPPTLISLIMALKPAPSTIPARRPAGTRLFIQSARPVGPVMRHKTASTSCTEVRAHTLSAWAISGYDLTYARTTGIEAVIHPGTEGSPKVAVSQNANPSSAVHLDFR